MLYRDTVTVFNYHNGIWRPKVLRNVHRGSTRSANLGKMGDSSSDSAWLHVRFRKSGNAVMIGPYRYVKPKEYAGGLFEITFAVDGEFSFFMDQEWTGDREIDDSEFENGFYNYMNETNDGVFAIGSVTKFSVLPHFEVSAK